MSNWTKELDYFKTILVQPLEVPEVQMKWLKRACTQAKKDQEKANSSMHFFGHVKEVYHFKTIAPHFGDFVLHSLQLPILKHYGASLHLLSGDKPFYLHDLWVNYQQRYEFNPPHDHTGVYSFVIFVKIPYDLKKEEKQFQGPDTYRPQASKFCFLNTDSQGKINSKPLDVDKSFEGKMLIFPSGQMHQVFPFYTSKDYRITVSGNIRIQV